MRRISRLRVGRSAVLRWQSRLLSWHARISSSSWGSSAASSKSFEAPLLLLALGGMVATTVARSVTQRTTSASTAATAAAPTFADEHEDAAEPAAALESAPAALHDMYEDATAFYLVMEYVSGGELFEALCDGGAYSEARAAEIVRQIADAAAFLHAQGLAHLE